MNWEYKKGEDVYYPDGSCIKNVHLVNYNEGEGWQLCGGDRYNTKGEKVSHIDEPGVKGVEGAVGYKQ